MLLIISQESFLTEAEELVRSHLNTYSRWILYTDWLTKVQQKEAIIYYNQAFIVITAISNISFFEGNGSKLRCFQLIWAYKKDLDAWISQYFFSLPADWYYEIPPQSIGPSSSHSQTSRLFLKIVDNLLITGIELKCIQHNLAELLELDYSAFHCQFYKEGCLELFFSVSTIIFNPLQSHDLELEPSREAYRITADLVTIL